MCCSVTLRLLAVCLTGAAALSAQVANPAEAWRRVGNTVLDLNLASPAGGPVDRVWFSADGQTLYAKLPSGSVWQTSDLEHWTPAAAEEPQAQAVQPQVELPETGAKSAVAASQQSRIYSANGNVWRSDDGGDHWTNVTAFEGRSILGGRVFDIAASPVSPDEVVVAGEHGLWRSVDGGSSWVGLNEGLPNLNARRLRSVPDTEPLVRISNNSGEEFIWNGGERIGWRPVDPIQSAADAALRSGAAAMLGTEVTAAARVQDQLYAAAADGRLFSSPDRGRTWRPQNPPPGAGTALAIFADNRDPLFALAITNSRQRGRVLRTLNGGVLWDDISGNLPPSAVNGITADRLTGAVYVATSAGVFMTYTDTVAASPATPWTLLREGAALDVMVGAAGNQLYVLSQGSGVFATLAPHRRRDPRVVSAGDRVLRAAAPGSLLSVIGTRVQSARAGDLPAPVLDSGESESQVQLPFELNGSSLMISMDSAAGRLQLGLPLSPTSPSIFVDRDGTALLLDGETGLMLDASTPARSGSRLQILASGLGKVTPSWPAGLAAPLQDPPRVVARLQAYLDREPIEVTSATLAPGYVGLYLVEVRLPTIVNRGTAELYIEAGDAISNRVKMYIEP